MLNFGDEYAMLKAMRNNQDLAKFTRVAILI